MAEQESAWCNCLLAEHCHGDEGKQGRLCRKRAFGVAPDGAIRPASPTRRKPAPDPPLGQPDEAQPEAASERCSGSGDDAYDQYCAFPEGHPGPCGPASPQPEGGEPGEDVPPEAPPEGWPCHVCGDTACRRIDHQCAPYPEVCAWCGEPIDPTTGRCPNAFCRGPAEPPSEPGEDAERVWIMRRRDWDHRGMLLTPDEAAQKIADHGDRDDLSFTEYVPASAAESLREEVERLKEFSARRGDQRTKWQQRALRAEKQVESLREERDRGLERLIDRFIYLGRLSSSPAVWNAAVGEARKTLDRLSSTPPELSTSDETKSTTTTSSTPQSDSGGSDG